MKKFNKLLCTGIIVYMAILQSSPIAAAEGEQVLTQYEISDASDEIAGKEVKLSSKKVYIDGYRVPYIYECEGRYYVKLSFFKEGRDTGIGVVDEGQEGLIGYRIYADPIEMPRDIQRIMVQTVSAPGTTIGKIKKTNKYVGDFCMGIFHPVWQVGGDEIIDLSLIIEAYNGKYKTDDSKNMIYIGNKTDEEINKLTAMNDPLYKVVAKYAKSAKNDRELVKKFHDFIVLWLQYSGDTEDPGNAIICYQSKKGVCEGYARLFKELCDRAFIPCELVSGYGNNEGHMWNKVFIDGKWLFVDCTFDDPIGNHLTASTMRYTYFLKTADQMYASHYWEGNDYILPDYNESWKKIDGNNIQSEEQWRKYVIAQIRQKKKSFTAKTKSGCGGGLAFLKYYEYNGQIACSSVTCRYNSSKGRYEITCNYY